MSWKLSAPPIPLEVPGADARAWDLVLEDGTRGHRTRFTVSGTAMAMVDEALPAGGAEARATGGVSALGLTLNWQVPPRRIELNSVELRTSGGTRITAGSRP